jgi:hypothetical protein
VKEKILAAAVICLAIGSISAILAPRPCSEFGAESETSVTYIGTGVSNGSIEEAISLYAMSAHLNKSQAAESNPGNSTGPAIYSVEDEADISHSNATLIQASNYSNRAPGQPASEPGKDDIPLMFASLVPMIGMPLLVMFAEERKKILSILSLSGDNSVKRGINHAHLYHTR